MSHPAVLPFAALRKPFGRDASYAPAFDCDSQTAVVEGEASDAVRVAEVSDLVALPEQLRM